MIVIRKHSGERKKAQKGVGHTFLRQYELHQVLRVSSQPAVCGHPGVFGQKMKEQISRQR